MENELKLPHVYIRCTLHETDPQILRFVAQKLFPRSADSEWEQIGKDLASGDAQIWVIPGVCFTLLSWFDTETGRVLFPACVEGKNCYNPAIFSLMESLAKETGCQRIEARALRPAIGRLLQRLGFSELPNGRFGKVL